MKATFNTIFPVIAQLKIKFSKIIRCSTIAMTVFYNYYIPTVDLLLLSFFLLLIFLCSSTATLLLLFYFNNFVPIALLVAL